MQFEGLYVYLCMALAVCRLSQAVWLPDSALPSMTHLSHQRSLQQVQGCVSPNWRCSMSAVQQMQLSDTTHAAVVSGNCTELSTSLGLWQCGANLVRGDVIAAVQQGSCYVSCIETQQQLCTQPPALAPAPSESFQPYLFCTYSLTSITRAFNNLYYIHRQSVTLLQLWYRVCLRV